MVAHPISCVRLLLLLLLCHGWSFAADPRASAPTRVQSQSQRPADNRRAPEAKRAPASRPEPADGRSSRNTQRNELRLLPTPEKRIGAKERLADIVRPTGPREPIKRQVPFRDSAAIRVQELFPRLADPRRASAAKATSRDISAAGSITSTTPSKATSSLPITQVGTGDQTAEKKRRAAAAAAAAAAAKAAAIEAAAKAAKAAVTAAAAAEAKAEQQRLLAAKALAERSSIGGDGDAGQLPGGGVEDGEGDAGGAGPRIGLGLGLGGGGGAGVSKGYDRQAYKSAKARARKKLKNMIQALEENLQQDDGEGDDDEGESREGGSQLPVEDIVKLKGLSLAMLIDDALEKEFGKETGERDTESAGRSFNRSLRADEAVLETVARLTPRGAGEGRGGNYSESAVDRFVDSMISGLFGIHVAHGSADAGDSAVASGLDSDDVPRLIDAHDNEFVMSNPKRAMELQQDTQFIYDVITVIICAALGGMAFGLMGQPMITGYILAGSIIGPGGFGLINELVQVETLAQFGVMFLLFCLGMEFSVSKLRSVRAVAIVGGFLEILLFMCLCGLIAKLAGGDAGQGVFVGAFLSMSSTAVVLKCLMDRGVMQSSFAQITVGTLILQDCALGLLFALLPVLGGSGDWGEGLRHITQELGMMALFVAFCAFLSRTAVPPLFRFISKLSIASVELYQLAALSFCLAVAMLSDLMGLSIELGCFVAGVMVSSTEYSERTLHQVRVTVTAGQHPVQYRERTLHQVTPQTSLPSTATL
eukprot:jgi/Mesvir1/15721/Mv03300-RA.2